MARSGPAVSTVSGSPVMPRSGWGSVVADADERLLLVAPHGVDVVVERRAARRTAPMSGCVRVSVVRSSSFAGSPSSSSASGGGVQRGDGARHGVASERPTSTSSASAIDAPGPARNCRRRSPASRGAIVRSCVLPAEAGSRRRTADGCGGPGTDRRAEREEGEEAAAHGSQARSRGTPSAPGAPATDARASSARGDPGGDGADHDADERRCADGGGRSSANRARACRRADCRAPAARRPRRAGLRPRAATSATTAMSENRSAPTAPAQSAATAGWMRAADDTSTRVATVNAVERSRPSASASACGSSVASHRSVYWRDAGSQRRPRRERAEVDEEAAVAGAGNAGTTPATTASTSAPPVSRRNASGVAGFGLDASRRAPRRGARAPGVRRRRVARRVGRDDATARRGRRQLHLAGGVERHRPRRRGPVESAPTVSTRRRRWPR